MEITREVKLSIAEMPATRRDVKSSNGKTKKLLVGASLGIAPIIDKVIGKVVTGTTRDEFAELFPGEDYDKFFKGFYIRISSEGKTLDLAEPMHKIIYNLMKVHPRVCLDPSKYNPGIHQIVLTDKEAEAEARIKLSDRKMKAYRALDEMSTSEMRKFLYLYGVNSKDASDTMIRSKIMEFVESDPDKFNTYYYDANKEERVFLKTLQSKGIVRKNGSSYFYGESGEDSIHLGANDEMAIEFLKNAKNQELKIRLIAELEEIE